MKTSRYSSTIVGSLVCLPLLLASVRLAHAQYTLVPASDYLNYYFFDGVSTAFGTDPTPVTTFGGSGPGTPLTSYSWLTTSPTPGAVPSGSFNTGPMSTVNASAQISYQQASLFVGSNSVSQAGVSPVGTSLLLNNTGPGQAELRLDWRATYTYSGPSAVATPDFLLLSISGGVNLYSILAGEENFQVNAGTPVTATIPIGGDFPAYPYPGAVNPFANFFGYVSPPTASFSATPNGYGGLQSINNGDTLTVTGFLDILVDPGSMQVTINAVPEPGFPTLALVGGLGLSLGFRLRARRLQPSS